jgi:Cu2+-exporting ATPase
MDCVGCEKKLYRSLESLPTISHIKTSLVLAQAEFDLAPTTSIDSNNITSVIERMTGFVCTKVTQLGSYLDVIADCSIQELFAATDLPAGVIDLTVIGKATTREATIRVAYRPEVVGARDLLSHTSFQKYRARLGPVAPRLMIASGRSHVRSLLFRTLLSALLTIPVLVLAWAPLQKQDVLYGGISLAFATIVQTVIAAPFYANALKALIFSRMIEMDLLIVLSTSVAFLYSIIAYAYLVVGHPLPTGQFFETSTLLVTLIMVGRLVSAYARQKAVESISIESLQTPTALLVDLESHQEREIDARLLQYQDTFKVLPHTSIVTDGIVIAGETEVDESMITGEATLVVKKPGMSVVAGSINHDGTLTAQLTRLPHENTIKTIGSLVDEAKSTKPKIQELADRVASIFVPVILIVTTLIFIVWIAVGMEVRHQSSMTASIVAMTYAISSLIISCPCAIGLAVPMVVAIAGGVAAKHGLIFKSAETIEIARNVSHVIFDKTGTLTQGKLLVVAESYPTGRPEILAPVVMGLTAHSKHPVALSITAHMEASGVQPEGAQQVTSIPGNGIEAILKGTKIRGGNPRWLGVENSPAVQEALSQGLTLFCVTMDEVLVAVFGLTDSLRPDAIEVVNELTRRSVDVSIVSGDNKAAVQAIAGLLGIPPSHVRSGCSPGDKQLYVQEMLARKDSVVVFCGDGTNDAIALAQASIGINMNEGTDIARGASDVVLMRPLLSNILVLIDLSKAFYRRVIFNFLWSFTYNVFAILLAAGAFPDARITPQFAGLGEIASVLPVIAIAMQLRWFKHQGFK